MSALVGTGERWDVLHLLVKRLVMDWPVVNADLVLASLEVVKVCYSVLHPVLIITRCEVLASMSSSALLE